MYCAIRAMHFAQGLIIACAHSESLRFRGYLLMRKDQKQQEASFL